MAKPENVIQEGKCACDAITYQLTDNPLFVHCCHCSWCQRETGSAFVLNALIEASAVRLTRGTPAIIATPSSSGRGQKISRCPVCQVALRSPFGGPGPKFPFVRVGTLLERARVPPDIHIYTSTKLPWVSLTPDIPAREGYYRREECWTPAALARLEAAKKG